MHDPLDVQHLITPKTLPQLESMRNCSIPYFHNTVVLSSRCYHITSFVIEMIGGEKTGSLEHLYRTNAVNGDDGSDGAF